MSHQTARGQTAVLATARVNVVDRSGEFHSARALIDQGAEGSIISEALVQKLRLPRQRTSIAVFDVGGQQTAVARGQVSLSISSLNKQHSVKVSAIVMPRLTLYAGVSSTLVRDWPHLRGLELADQEFCASDSINILLGADVLAEIIGPGIRKGGPHEPIAQQTDLGWIVSGTVAGEVSSHLSVRMHQCTLSDPLSTIMRKFWEQEEINVTSTPLSSEEQQCEELFTHTHTHTHTRALDGRYTVRLPVKAPLPNLSATREAAVRMLQRMENRFEKDSSFHGLYTSFMQQYEELQHMTRMGHTDNMQKVCYLPHHGVLKESSATTKLRVVFNGSYTTGNGRSLNAHLLVGPNLLPQLADVLLRWRWHKYVFVADIEKMYRQILVHPDDRDLQRVLWRPERNAAIEEYQLNTVTYGLACAPYLAMRALRQLAEDEALQFPRGAATLKQDVYVDDILSGAPTTTDALEI
ncbi:PREDICTED: uncharacterized protein LOC108777321 [Cyphomyrmex costatus]|uniref:uncharacterized protein LOC108777321 n=1 Tax=Cyphomyrmex costatus TaxID=456900 RepID=UPI0008523DFF|nr:PREDICTED: uncharacterized protein LOC108777321 [Cyphomyrmex costatus]